MEIKDYQKYHDKLLLHIQELYKMNYKGIVPIILNKLSKELLLKYPKNIFLKQ